MAQRGPLVTAVVVVGGLVGLMTANAAGGLVTAGGPPPSPTEVGATQTETPTTTTEPPVETTTAPPLETTTAPPVNQPPANVPAFPTEAVYAGKTADSPLWVAVAVKGTDAAAYLCDGKAVESWLRGKAENGSVDLESNDKANTLTAKLQGEQLVGSVTVAGVPHQFTIGIAPPPAGLYRGADGQTDVGWIVLSNGQQVGIANTASGRGPAPKLDPRKGGATVDGRFVPATKVTGEQ